MWKGETRRNKGVQWRCLATRDDVMFITNVYCPKDGHKMMVVYDKNEIIVYQCVDCGFVGTFEELENGSIEEII